MNISDIEEKTLEDIVRTVLSKHAPTMNMDRFENLCKNIARDVFLHITSYRKEDDIEQ